MQFNAERLTGRLTVVIGPVADHFEHGPNLDQFIVLALKVHAGARAHQSVDLDDADVYFTPRVRPDQMKPAASEAA